MGNQPFNGDRKVQKIPFSISLILKMARKLKKDAKPDFLRKR
jgi:hypothetical protein